MTAQPVDTTNTTKERQAAQGPATPAWHELDETADVRFLPSGLPLALRWHGSLWQITGDPVAWSSSSSWPEPATTPPPGPGGQGRVLTTQFWRFQAQTGPASPVLEFEMTADPRWGTWRLRRVAHITEF